MSLIVNTAEHPNVEIRTGDLDDAVHIFNQFGEAWCQTDDPPDDIDEVITASSKPDGDDPDMWLWCHDCRSSGLEEGVLING